MPARDAPACSARVSKVVSSAENHTRDQQYRGRSCATNPTALYRRFANVQQFHEDMTTVRNTHIFGRAREVLVLIARRKWYFLRRVAREAPLGLAPDRVSDRTEKNAPCRGAEWVIPRLVLKFDRGAVSNRSDPC